LKDMPIHRKILVLPTDIGVFRDILVFRFDYED